MACVERLARHLEETGAAHEVLPHPRTQSAESTAPSSHIPARQFAKVVLLRTGHAGHVALVLPADRHVDLPTARRVIGEDDLEFCNEDDLHRIFPDCELGAMPPFPRLWRLPSVLDPCFDEEADLYFNAGNHGEVVRMAFAAFYRIAGPFTHEGCVHTQQIHA